MCIPQILDHYLLFLVNYRISKIDSFHFKKKKKKFKTSITFFVCLGLKRAEIGGYKKIFDFFSFLIKKKMSKMIFYKGDPPKNVN